MNCLPSEDNPQEANQQIDKYLIDILRSASGKNDAAPKRGKKISFASQKNLSISNEKDTESEGEQESEYQIWILNQRMSCKTLTSVKMTMRIMIQTKFQGFCEGFPHSQLIKIKKFNSIFCQSNIRSYLGCCV